MNDYPTTRRYPRTLSEAFPSGTEYANAIEHARRYDASGKLIVAVVLVIVAFAWVIS